jgi:eukaryotic-like serine/threonine-protein kinase
MHPGLGIDAATWLRIDPLLDAALELSPAERDAWLTTLPKQHDDLKALLRTLLGRASRIGNAALLDALPAMDTTDDGAAHAAHHSAGELIGPYRLLRELGVGGMGAVWLAERADGLMAQRHVALKLPFLSVGPFQGDLAARIAREREILATLDHPHIARLYDAGIAANGQPFLALEHVDGQRIDRWCNERQLGVKARLRLFLQAARAVAQAHAQLVVHRDIKPSNLLVDAAGQVKLLDFGIAKLLQAGEAPAADVTQQGARALTPDYAAPEQIAGQAVGTRTDVYALGVLLFELLTGARPYRLKRDSRAALEEAILAAEVPRPSEVAGNKALRRELRGDLDTIVLEALKKPVGERYASVDALAEDIQRHLSSRPVLARPDRLGYRTRKFIVRNRLAVGTASALLLTVLVGAGTALWQARIAIAERERAEAVKEFIAAIFSEASPYAGSGNKDLTAVDLLKQADKKLEAAAIGSASVRIELTNMIGAGLIGLGDVAVAEPVVLRAVSQAEHSLTPGHEQAVLALYLRSQIHRMRGRAQQASDDVDAVLPHLRERINTKTGATDLTNALFHRTIAAIDVGAYAEAERFALEGFALAQSRLAEKDPVRVASGVALAQAYRHTRKFDLALVIGERVYREATALYGGAAPNQRMSEARNVYARALADSGELSRGIAMLESSVADTRTLLGPKSRVVGIVLHNLVAYRMDLGELEMAHANAVEALEILGGIMPRDAPSYAIAEHSLAAVHLARRNAPAALAAATHAAEVLDRKLGAKHENAIAARTTMALALMMEGRQGDAARELDAVAPHAAALAPNSPPVARVALARGTLARLRGGMATAMQHLRDVADSTDSSPKWQRERMRAWVQIGLVQLDQGAPAEGVASFERAIKEFERLETSVTPARADALLGLGRTHLAQGEAAKALPLLEQADAFWRGFDPASKSAATASQWLARARAAARG